jgi:DNA-binding NarL/FixJ family response regulator
LSSIRSRVTLPWWRLPGALKRSAPAESLRGRQPATTGALTSTEERVADLAVAGRTNKQIAAELYLSARAVEANLTRIYRKLQVRSRTELASTRRREQVR